MELLPCPFCGKKPDLEDPDTLYPNGFFWREVEPGLRGYFSRKDHKAGDGVCHSMSCPTPAGGCGAEIVGDSLEEAVEAWNRRYYPSDPRAIQAALHEAISAIYFADSSDYESALWGVVQRLSPGTVALLESDPGKAWEKTRP